MSINLLNFRQERREIIKGNSLYNLNKTCFWEKLDKPSDLLSF